MGALMIVFGGLANQADFLMTFGINNEIAIIVVTMGVFIIAAASIGCTASACKLESLVWLVNLIFNIFSSIVSCL